MVNILGNRDKDTGLVEPLAFEPEAALPDLLAPEAVAAPRLLSRDSIMGADDITFEDVEVPEWGGTVRVRALSGDERDKFESSVMTTNKKGQPEFNTANMRGKLVALACVDGKGRRIFNDSDAAALGKKGAAPLERVYEVASRLSRISKQDEDELAKNSSSALNGGSPTD